MGSFANSRTANCPKTGDANPLVAEPEVDFNEVMSSLVTNLNSLTAQEIVYWVTTAYGCVHTADATQLDS